MQKHADSLPAPYESLARKPLASFSSASLTLSLTPTAQYDQAGLLLILHPPPTYSTPASLSQGPSNKDKYWIKTGVEFYDSAPRVSTVACKDWADWSIAPLTGPGGDKVEARIVVQRVVDHHGPSLWVYREEGGRKEPLREVCWVCGLEEEGAGSGWEVEVAAYAARPDEKGEGELEARFRDVKVEWV